MYTCLTMVGFVFGGIFVRLGSCSDGLLFVFGFVFGLGSWFGFVFVVGSQIRTGSCSCSCSLSRCLVRWGVRDLNVFVFAERCSGPTLVMIMFMQDVPRAILFECLMIQLVCMDHQLE